MNAVTEHDDEAIDVEKKCYEIVMDGLTDSKEVKELKQCDETHNDILEKDMKEDTSEPKIVEKVNDDERIIGRGVTISQFTMRNVRISDIGKMTFDLMSCIFTNKEMAFSSRTGKK